MRKLRLSKMRPHAPRPLSKVSANRDLNLHWLLPKGTLAALLALANSAKEVSHAGSGPSGVPQREIKMKPAGRCLQVAWKSHPTKEEG